MVSTLKLSASSRCVKYLMFIFNLLFVITGVILLSIGSTILAVYRNYQHFLDNKFLSVPNLLIAIGAIIFIIAFFGCCGAVRENYCMILTFTSLLVIVFILEFFGGIFGYVLRNHATEIVEGKMLETLPMYQNNGSEITRVWDELQEDFKCCGVENATDWTTAWKTENKSLPSSCCWSVQGSIGGTKCSLDSGNVYAEGCFPAFLAFIKAHAAQLGGIGLGIAFVQAIGIWFAVYLARSIKASYETV